MNAVDPDHVAERIEIDVARLLDRMPEIDGAVPAFLPALEGTAEKGRRARTEHFEVRRDDAFLERGGRHGHFERRARRIAPLDRAILQRPELVGVERRPGGLVDPACERVGIVGRHAREGEHFAVARIEDDGGAVEPGPLEAVFERFLNVFVDRQPEALAFRCGIFVKRPDFASHAVDHDNLRAVLAHQQVVVDLLDA